MNIDTFKTKIRDFLSFLKVNVFDKREDFESQFNSGDVFTIKFKSLIEKFPDSEENFRIIWGAKGLSYHVALECAGIGCLKQKVQEITIDFEKASSYLLVNVETPSSESRDRRSDGNHRNKKTSNSPLTIKNKYFSYKLNTVLALFQEKMELIDTNESEDIKKDIKLYFLEKCAKVCDVSNSTILENYFECEKVC